MSDNSRPTLVESLTEREMDVLALLVDGKSNREIAAALVISVNTVKWYARQIYGKLSVENREEAAEKALALDLLPNGRAESLPKHNLPAQLTPFIGRRRELASLLELMADPAVRLLTIVGPGGIGKTRLALEAAARRLRTAPEALRDGVFFVGLAEAEALQDLTEGLITTLGVPGMREEEDPAGRLRDYLSDKKALLLLDNVEHLAGEGLAGWLAQLLGAAPAVNVLATSRRRLNLLGEQIFWVEGLQLPASGEVGQGQDAEQLLAVSSALSLFVTIAGRVQPDFALTTENIGPVVELCRLVEGMPLGIELAAGWMGLLEPAELLSELERTPDVLATEAGNVPARQQSLRAVFNTSWRLLTTQERETMRALSIFRGGFTLAAAEELAGAGLPLLLALMDKCWLKREVTGRFSLHELPRQYGMEALAADPEQFEEVRGRHSRYYCGWLADRETATIGRAQEAVLAELEREMGNLLSACRQAARAGESELLYPALNTLGRYYRWRGRYLTGDRTFSDLLEAVGSSGRSSDEWQIVRARMLTWRMTLNSFLGRSSRIQSYRQQASALVERLEEDGHSLPFERMRIAIESGYFHLHHAHDLQKALHHFSVAQELARLQDSPWHEGMTLCALGRARRNMGDLEEADKLIAQGIGLLETDSAAPALAEAIGARITILLRMGRPREAESLLEAEPFSGPHPAAGIYRRFFLARIRFLLGAFAQADALAGEAWALCREMKMAKEGMWVQILQARTKLHQGDYKGAVTLARASPETPETAWKSEALAFALYLKGARALVEGEWVTAGDCVRQSLARHPYIGAAHLSYAKACLALAARGAGNPDEARRYLVDDLTKLLASRTLPGLYLPLMAATLLLADDGAHEQAGALSLRMAQEPFVHNSVWLQAVAGQELDEIVAHLSPAAKIRAVARGQSLDLWELAATLLQAFAAG